MEKKYVKDRILKDGSQSWKQSEKGLVNLNWVLTWGQNPDAINWLDKQEKLI